MLKSEKTEIIKKYARHEGVLLLLSEKHTSSI